MRPVNRSSPPAALSFSVAEKKLMTAELTSLPCCICEAVNKMPLDILLNELAPFVFRQAGIPCRALYRFTQERARFSLDLIRLDCRHPYQPQQQRYG
jgi:hypothetical protein